MTKKMDLFRCSGCDDCEQECGCYAWIGAGFLPENCVTRHNGNDGVNWQKTTDYEIKKRWFSQEEVDDILDETQKVAQAHDPKTCKVCGPESDKIRITTDGSRKGDFPEPDKTPPTPEKCKTCDHRTERRLPYQTWLTACCTVISADPICKCGDNVDTGWCDYKPKSVPQPPEPPPKRKISEDILTPGPAAKKDLEKLGIFVEPKTESPAHDPKTCKVCGPDSDERPRPPAAPQKRKISEDIFSLFPSKKAADDFTERRIAPNLTTPNCAICRWNQEHVLTHDDKSQCCCASQGYQYFKDVYNTPECKRLFSVPMKNESQEGDEETRI